VHTRFVRLGLAFCMYVSKNIYRQYAFMYAYICIHAIVQENCAGTHLLHSSRRGIYYVCIHVCTSAVCVNAFDMGWLRLVGSLKL